MSVHLDGYVRVSRVAGRSGDRFLSPGDQRARIEAWAQATGRTLGTVHEDLDEPGTRADRPGLLAALERVESGATEGVVVAKLDRFGRSVLQQAQLLKQLHAADGRLYTVAEGIDSRGPTGNLIATILGAIGEWELERIRENWQTARAAAVARGVHVSGHAPAGYLRDAETSLLSPDPATSWAITEAFRMRAAGESWKGLADYLTGQEIPTAHGAPRWTIATVRTVIRNRVYLGEARAGDLVNPDAHEPIIDAATWRAANQRRGLYAARSGSTAGMLSGIIRCAGCSFALKPAIGKTRHGKRRREYRCRPDKAAGRCPAPASVSAEPVERVVVERFFAELGDASAQAHTRGQERDDAAVAVERARAELAAALDGRLADALGGENADAYIQTVRARREALEDAERRLTDTEALTALPDATTLRATWPDLELQERRVLLGSAFESIFLRRATGPTEPAGDRLRIFGPGESPPLPVRGQRGTIRSVDVD